MKVVPGMSIVIVCLSVALCSSIRAQISIDATDVGRVFQAGNTVTWRFDTVAASINIGTPGPGRNTWDFSGLLNHRSQTPRSVAVASTPWISDFTGATHALAFDTTVYGYSGTIYSYQQLTTAQFRNRGAEARTTTPFGQIVLRISMTPDEVVYSLPAAVNTLWTTAYVVRTLVTLQGQTFSDVSHTYNARYTIDAFGSMRLPGGGQPVEALRIRKLNFYDGIPTMSFLFLSRGGALVQVQAADTLTSSGVISLFKGDSTDWKTKWNPSVVTEPTSVPLINSSPAEFALDQNWPNPFNPVTNVQFSISNRQLTTLKVYDVLGGEVATLVNEVKQPGTYTVQWDASRQASGVYFYRLQAGDFRQTRKLIVLK